MGIKGPSGIFIFFIFFSPEERNFINSMLARIGVLTERGQR